MATNQHVVPRNGEWAVLGEGNSKDTSRHSTQSEAIEAGREHAINQHSELVIHGRDGKFREAYSYGNDPYPPKG